MSFSDEVLGTKEIKTNKFNTGNNKDNWKEKQKQDRKEIYDSMDRIAKIISVDEEKFKEYLDIQSKFPKYSVGNCCVILEKAPYATQIKDKMSWEEKKVQLIDRAKGIKILEPVKKEGKIYYNPKVVYDISQTNSEKKPDFVYDTKKLLDAVTKDCHVNEIAVDVLPSGKIGVEFNKEENTIYVCRKLDKKTLFQGLFREIAKIDLKEENNMEFRSCCISYMLCKKYNIDVSDFKFESISNYVKGGTPKDIRHELELSRGIFEKINTKVAEYFEVSGKEKSKENLER